ncbi:hypothetical protein AB0I34_10700 [Kribbella sp. NPDC050281]|uniref:hypothetical protein n=1 Tax=Kribbella sp. NPDC050281 TaxID=3155515 RepID=UPI0033F7620A
MESEDPRRRPVVLQSRSAEPASTRRPARYLAWAGTGLLGLAAAAGLVAGGTAVWTAFDPGTPNESPAQLWLPPPVTVNPQSATVTPTPTLSPDDHGGDRTRTPSPTRTTERGDDKGGDRTTTKGSNTIEPGDDKGGDSGTSGKGKSGDDGSGHG